MLPNFVSCVLSVVVCLALLINLVIRLLLLSFRNFVIGRHLRRKYGKSVEFLTSKDTAFALDTEKNRMHGNICIVVKGKADVTSFQNRVGATWMRAKNKDGRLTYWKLTQQLRCEFGYFFWLPENDFRVEDHVYHREDVELKNDDEMHRFLAEVFDRPFANALSPWFIMLVDLAENYPGLEPGPHHLLCMCHHHALADGVSSLRLHYLYLYDQLRVNEGKSISARPKRASTSELLTRFIKAFVNGPSAVFYNWLVKKEEEHILLRKPLTGIKLFGFSKPMSLTRVKRVKDASKTTVNDVLIACISGALRSHFLKKGRTPKSLTHVLPVSMHDPKGEVRLENNTAVIFFTDAAGESTPKARLSVTKKNMDAVKDTKQACAYQLVVTSGSNIYPRYFTDVLARSVNVTGCISNVHGPTESRFILGKEVARIGFFVPSPPNIGVGISIFSYRDHIQFGLKVDSALIDSQRTVDGFLDDILRELEELEKSLNICQ